MKKINKIIKKIQDKPENEKVRIMWILVVFCVVIMIGIWKINLELNKLNRTNPINNSNNLNIPSSSKLEEKIKKLDRKVDDLENLKEEKLKEELSEKDKKKIEENKMNKELEN